MRALLQQMTPFGVRLPKLSEEIPPNIYLFQHVFVDVQSLDLHPQVSTSKAVEHVDLASSESRHADSIARPICHLWISELG